MSGIAGIIRFDGAPVEPALIASMTSAMPWRGPDGINHWVQGSVALGQCMMRTTPSSLEETQPLTNEDASLVLAMDGWLSNWEELRAELLSKGAHLRTRADAELVLRAYEAWGKSCLTHIDGDFAFVIWDARCREAFCARDRLGIKPFHYHWNGTVFSFSSEVKPILQLPWVRRQLNEGMVAELLAATPVTRDETFWVGIQRLIPAHAMTVARAGSKVEQYWLPDLHAKPPCTSDADYAAYYRELLSDQVRRTARTNGPLACEVSGGLDSSAIFAVAGDLLRKGKITASNVEGYTLKFEGETDANELDYARAVAVHTGLAVHEIEPTRKPLDWYLQRARRLGCFPQYPNGTMGLGIRKTARDRGSRVLLGGGGGDEWLWGTRTYYAEAIAEGRWRDLRGYIAEDARSVGLSTSLWWALRYGCYPALPRGLRQVLRAALASDDAFKVEPRAWLSPKLKSALQLQTEKATTFSRSDFARPGQLAQLLLLMSPHSVQGIEIEEIMAAEAGIEVRHPFYSAAIIQFAFSTSERLRMRGNIHKFLHRRAMKGLLPEIVLERNTKADFISTYRWYSNELSSLLTSNDKSRDNGDKWVTASGLSHLLEKVARPQHGGWPEHLLWSLVCCRALAS